MEVNQFLAASIIHLNTLLPHVQVRKLLRDNGLEQQRRRGGAAADGNDGWSSDDDEPKGPVLGEVDQQQLEALYQEHLADDDYLDKVRHKQLLQVLWWVCPVIGHCQQLL